MLAFSDIAHTVKGIYMSDLLSQGVELMLFGMGSVFTFLTLLVFSTIIMSKLVTRFAPEPEPAAPSTTPNAAPQGADATLLAVISQAIKEHKDRQK